MIDELEMWYMIYIYILYIYIYVSINIPMIYDDMVDWMIMDWYDE